MQVGRQRYDNHDHASSTPFMTQFNESFCRWMTVAGNLFILRRMLHSAMAVVSADKAPAMRAFLVDAVEVITCPITDCISFTFPAILLN